jgi:hypothetical protein
VTSPATAAGAAAGTGAGTGGSGNGVQPGGGSSASGQGGGTQGGQQQDSPAGGQQAAGKGSEGSGLYDEYLQGIPAQLHGTVTEAFKKWDANVTKNQQGVRSQLAAYQPLIDSGADPQQLQVAHQFVEWLQEDPAEAMRQMMQTFELDPQELLGGQQQQPGAMTPGQQQGGTGDEGLTAGQGDPQGGETPPWFTQFQEQTFGPIQEMVQLMAQAQVQDHQSKQSEQEIDQLEQLLTSKGVQLTEGDPQLGYVLGQLALADGDDTPLEQVLDSALESWKGLQTTISGQTASANAPRVLSAGGGLPTQQVDPTSLSQKDRRALAVQRATEMMAQNRG